MISEKFNKWIFDTYPFQPRDLAAYRIFYSLFILFVLMPGRPSYLYYNFMADLPSDLFFPPYGPMFLLSGFPPAWFYLLLETGIVVTAVLLLVGYKTRWISLLLGILILIGNGFSYSMGKINHDIIVPLIPLFMAFSGWGAYLSADKKLSDPPPVDSSWPVPAIAIFLGFMMFTAGFPKILGGWLSLESFATYGHLINQHFINGRTDFLSAFFVGLDSPVFWVFLDYATILFEVGFLFAVFSFKWMRIFCCLAVIFHFSVMMMLNISFTPNLIVYALFIFDWRRAGVNIELFIRKNAFIREPRFVLSAGSLLILTALFFPPLYWLNSLMTLQSDMLFYETVVLSIFLILALRILFRTLTEMVLSSSLKLKVKSYNPHV